MLEVTCPHCGLRMQLSPSVKGKSGPCFNCGQTITTPTDEQVQRHLDLSFDEGDRVGDRYTIAGRIGKGGMGVVYRAHDILVDEDVALKFMSPRLLTEKGKKLFIQEAQIARRLRHENIIAVHDVSWTNEGILYLSMELAEGQSLRDLLRKHREQRRLMSVRLGVGIIRQVLAALENAHRMVIHRDIKPENIMILPGERVKVLDFGLAKAVQEDILAKAAERGLADHGEGKNRAVGTLAYAAPEQKLRQGVDLRADIYSVGLVFHELLTLRTPLDKAVTVGQVREDVSPSLLTVLNRALTEERESRWQSATAFREALERAWEDSYQKKSVQISVPTRSAPPSTEGMVFLTGGSFLMGNTDVREQAPEEEVYVGPFWIDVFPVTVAKYEAYLNATGNPPPKLWRDDRYSGPNQPVVGVTWEEALAYCAWCGKALPTEAQWEFAARGQENRRFPWGNLPPSSTLANYNDFLGMPSIVTMHEDGQTPDGVQDLAGNMYEWTIDPYTAYSKLRALYADPEADPRTASAPRRSVRGGCFESPEHELQTTFRRGFFPESQLPTIGFRCVIPVADQGH
jgi:serine/threonine protein kinase